MQKTAISYIRFSTKAQIRGDSLARQLAGARDYAKRHNLKLDESSYRDLGISAFKGKNATEGALKAFLDAVDEGTIPSDVTLLVESFDRLSREAVQDAYDTFRSITKRGVTIVTLMDEQVFSRKTIDANWAQLIISLAMMARAHEESVAKSLRVRHAKKSALEAGKKHGKVPMWLTVNDDGKSFTVIAEKAELVRKMFAMRLEGIGSLRIAQHLNEAHDFKWGSPQVAHTLKNPAVIGTRISQAGYEPLIGYYEPIIEKTLFYEVQKLMSATGKGNHSGRRVEDEPNLFTGIARCASCGGSMRFFRATKNVSQRYLKCLNSIIRKGCHVGYVNYDALEQEIIGWLLMDQDEEIVPILEKKPARKNAVHGAEIQALKDQQARLIDLAASGLMNTRLVSEKMNAIELQIKDHEVDMVQESIEGDDELLPAEKAWSLAVRHQDTMLGDDKEAWYAVRRELKTAFQKSIDEIRVYSEERIGNELHGKVSVIFRGYDGEPVREYKRPALTRIKGVWNSARAER